MTRAVLLGVVLLASCGGSPPPESEPPPAPPANVAPLPPPATSSAETSTALTPVAPEPTREEREKRVIELLEGKVPAPDLPSDSGGG